MTIRGRYPAGLVLTAALALSGCMAQQRDSARHHEATPISSDEPTIDWRPFRPLDSDQPAGPHHEQPLAAEPTHDELEAAAHGGPGRREAETFAILVNHALKDQTPGSQGDSVVSEFGDGVPPDSLAAIEETRNFPGNRIVPGGRPFVRSTVSVTASGHQATVYVVEKIEGPDLFEPKKLFVSWSQTTLTLAWTGTQWKVIDYQDAAASEKPRFSPSTWAGTMGSGRDWRRFDVAGAD